MSTKDKIRESLSAYLDAELSDAESQRVAREIEADPALQSESAELAATRDLLRALPVEHAPEDLVSRVLAEAERSQLVGAQHSERLSGPFRWVRYLATAAVLLVAASVGVIVAVTLWSPPCPEYETSLAYEPAGPAATARNGRRRGLGTGPTGRPAGKLGDATIPARTKDLGAMGLTHRKHAMTESAGDYSFFKKGGDLLAHVGNNEIIFTDRMALTLREVEKVLRSNGIEPMVAETSDNKKLQKKAPALARGNVYRQNQRSVRQVQYEAWVTPEQMPKVQNEIRGIRAGQEVSQVLAMAPTKRGSGQAGSAAARSREEALVPKSAKAEQKKSADAPAGQNLSEELEQVTSRGRSSRRSSVAPAAPGPKAMPKPRTDVLATPKRIKPDEDGPGETDDGRLGKHIFGITAVRPPAPAARLTPPTPLTTAAKRQPRSLATGGALMEPTTRPTALGTKPSQADTTLGVAVARAAMDANDDKARKSAIEDKRSGKLRFGEDQLRALYVKAKDDSGAVVSGAHDERPSPAPPGQVHVASAAALPVAKPAASPPASGKADKKAKSTRGGEIVVSLADGFGRQGSRSGVAASQVATRLIESTNGALALTQPAATRPILVTVASQPATREGASAEYGWATVARQHERGVQKELSPSALRRIAPGGDLDEQFQWRGATSQRAIARLQRLLITVNFRVPSGPANRATSTDARVKKATSKD